MERKDEMTIAFYPVKIKRDKKLYKCYNWLENNKNIIYGEGVEDRNIEIANNMLSENCEIFLISKVTGLTLEDIEILKEKELNEHRKKKMVFSKNNTYVNTLN